MKQPFLSNKRQLLFVATTVLGLILMLILVLAAISGRLRSPDTTVSQDAESKPDSTVWVSDGANVIPITPYPGVSVSKLVPEDFSRTDTQIRYHGSAYTALQGLDVSSWQESIDWAAVAGDGIDFAFIRIGFRASKTGLIEEDSCFSANLSGALENGIQVGVYFFSQAISEEEAKEEAAWVLDRLNNQPLVLPIMFDWEPIRGEDSRTVAWEGNDLTAFGQAFCNAIREAGYKSGIYFNLQQCYYCYDLSAFSKDVLWLSEPYDYPSCYYAVTYWQYTFSGNIAGIQGSVDRCLMFLPRVGC